MEISHQIRSFSLYVPKKKKNMWRCPKMGPKTSSKSSSKVIKSHQKSPVIDYLNNWKSMKKSLKPVFYGYLWAFTLSKTGSNDQAHEISRAPVARRGHRGASRCAVASARCGSLRWWSQRATRRAQCLAKWRKVNGDSMGDFSSIFHGVIFLDLVEVNGIIVGDLWRFNGVHRLFMEI